jgi:hypothetical protein
MVQAQFGRRVTLSRQASSGVDRARHRGLHAARGDLITFLDDDDLMHPDKIARQVALFAARPNLGVVHCAFDFIDRAGQFLEYSGRLPEGDVRARLMWGCFPWSGGPLVRRACLETIGPDEHRDWFGDWGLWLRTAFAGSAWGCVQESLGGYRMLTGSMTDALVANVERLIMHVLDESYARFELPAETQAQRPHITAGWRLYIALRYYAGGFWADGARNVDLAARLRPEWAADPDDAIATIVADAIGPRMRVRDPLAFIEGVLAHLPESAAAWAVRRDQALAEAQLGLALRDFAAGRDADGRSRWADAIARQPSIAGPPERFAERVLGYAHSLPPAMRPDYVAGVMHNLPIDRCRLSGAQARLMADLTIDSAFGDWADGRRASVPPKVLAAIRHRPALLRNRGVVSILMRSLPDYFGQASRNKEGQQS